MKGILRNCIFLLLCTHLFIGCAQQEEETDPDTQIVGKKIMNEGEIELEVQKLKNRHMARIVIRKDGRPMALLPPDGVLDAEPLKPMAPEYVSLEK